MAAISSTSALHQALTQQATAGAAHAWLDTQGRLVFGSFPTAHSFFDFATENIVSLDSKPPAPKRRISFLKDAARITERYTIETPDAIYEVGSNKQLLVEGLNIVEEHRPGTHAELSKIKKRTKRPVAQFRDDLYDTKHPVDHSAELKSGYFVATNNKANESKDYLKTAVELAGLKWGQNFVVQRS